MSFQARNDSLEQARLRQQDMIPLPSAILFTCLAPLTALGNGFLLLTFYRNSPSLLRTPSNFFIFSMAWANFLTGCVLQPLLAYRYYSIYLKNDLLLALRKMSFRTSKRSTKVERRMRMIIFLFTLVTTIPILPVTVEWYVTWYCSKCQRNQELVLAEKVLNQLVFVKFVLDPFVYAWRLERYRKALKRMLCCSH
ncbi:hypothetical protein OS493_025915 [Desmophyllum pertusum]|uniref:G-protein coupled receptors family 1 profile domain-containing protein n=1 Tax=Desmophyllum pertusum TaxID=174260 RepID=A0A9X0CQ10_9CNID|nr:hypothetical protein OS493_025915 [Desmophyllum pertusum]